MLFIQRYKAVQCMDVYHPINVHKLVFYDDSLQFYHNPFWNYIFKKFCLEMSNGPHFGRKKNHRLLCRRIIKWSLILLTLLAWFLSPQKWKRNAEILFLCSIDSNFFFGYLNWALKVFKTTKYLSNDATVHVFSMWKSFFFIISYLA